jgi:agmatinase
MMTKRHQVARDDDVTFLGFPRCADLSASEAEVAILGIPLVTSYAGQQAVKGSGAEHLVAAAGASAAEAPHAIRVISQNFIKYRGNHDFDIGGPLLGRNGARLYDCGDVAVEPDDVRSLSEKGAAAVRTLVSRKAIPIVIGGDHATTIPVLRGFEGHAPLCVIQVDAHMDFRDELAGFREGYSSPIRRASEMAWVSCLAQIGLRGWGSARAQDIRDAEAFGSVMITAEEVHDIGMDAVLRRLPLAENYYITLDIDGLDPSIAPGVLFPSHGGLTYYQVAKLLRGVAENGRIVGMDLVEVVPQLDVGHRTSLLATRLILDLIGFLIRTGQVGSR